MTADGEGTEMVDDYKYVVYVGTIIDSKLAWTSNMDDFHMKGLQHLYFMRILRQFKVDTQILVLFYRSFALRAFTFSSISLVLFSVSEQ